MNEKKIVCNISLGYIKEVAEQQAMTAKEKKVQQWHERDVKETFNDIEPEKQPSKFPSERHDINDDDDVL